MVYYLKYRPQTVQHLDSEDVKKTLTSVLSSDSIPHAFLFTGPKGLGKTSTARIVAKYVNCELQRKIKEKGQKTSDKRLESIPCNTCSSCTSITDGTNLDVLEIDAASNRGIDEMRDLREKIRLLPVSAKKKVYIIDEVHMLTTEAFNALLKTLEEPPPHAMFILCTTESHKVPDTILSRCFHIAFKKAGVAELVHSFERITESENIVIERDVLESIASLADGSFRDGAKVLEEIVIASKGEKITKDMLGTLYHTKNIESDILELLSSFQEHDARKGLQVVQRLTEVGTDMKYFLEQAVLFLHTILLANAGVTREKAKLTIDMVTLKAIVSVFVKAHSELKNAVLPQLPLELAIIEWKELHESGIRNQESRAEKNPVIARPQLVEVKLKMPGGVQSQKEIVTPSATPHDDKTFLHQILDTIKGEHHMLAGVLRSCKVSLVKDTVTIEVPSAFHKERLSDKKALEVLEKVCKEVVGQTVHISVILKVI